MKSSEIIDKWQSLGAIKRELLDAQKRRQQLDLEKVELDVRIRLLDREVNLLEKITEIVDGVPIWHTSYSSIYGKGYKIGAPGDDNGRAAEIYVNAHTRTDFCLKITKPRDGAYTSTETFGGCGWRFGDAKTAALRWVIGNAVPSDDLRRMSGFLNKLDPESQLPLLYQQAFEAAWIAKSYKLAEKLVKDGLATIVKE